MNWNKNILMAQNWMIINLELIWMRKKIYIWHQIDWNEKREEKSNRNWLLLQVFFFKNLSGQETGKNILELLFGLFSQNDIWLVVVLKIKQKTIMPAPILVPLALSLCLQSTVRCSINRLKTKLEILWIWNNRLKNGVSVAMAVCAFYQLVRIFFFGCIGFRFSGMVFNFFFPIENELVNLTIPNARQALNNWQYGWLDWSPLTDTKLFAYLPIAWCYFIIDDWPGWQDIHTGSTIPAMATQTHSNRISVWEKFSQWLFSLGTTWKLHPNEPGNFLYTAPKKMPALTFFFFKLETKKSIKMQ